MSFFDCLLSEWLFVTYFFSSNVQCCELGNQGEEEGKFAQFRCIVLFYLVEGKKRFPSCSNSTRAEAFQKYSGSVKPLVLLMKLLEISILNLNLIKRRAVSGLSSLQQQVANKWQRFISTLSGKTMFVTFISEVKTETESEFSWNLSVARIIASRLLYRKQF